MTKRPTTRPPAIEPLLVNADIAAPLLSVSKRTLSELTRAGEIPSLKIGRRRLYPFEGLKEWVRHRTEEGRR